MSKRKLSAIGVMTAATAAVSLIGAAPAWAGPSVDCDVPNVCIHYNSSTNGYGAYFEQKSSINDYAPYTFRTGDNGSSGAGLSVKNNAAFIWNRNDRAFQVFYNSYFSCAVACQTIAPHGQVNLNSQLKNNNASGMYK
ncbi:hypothetical protein [Streptomyces microflavus]|uniref:hypothetical protein n=1 Tax=Streptomyces microflavus TaxID=1919 RepID=UPI003818F63A